MQTRIVTSRVLAERRFSMADQVDFANLSGDFNSAHIDARRMQFGLPIVHGFHAVLWVLESFFACNKSSTASEQKLTTTKEEAAQQRSFMETAKACAKKH